MGLGVFSGGGQPENNPLRLVVLPLALDGSNMARWPVCGCGEQGLGAGFVLPSFLCWHRKKEWVSGEVAASMSSHALWQGSYAKPCIRHEP